MQKYCFYREEEIFKTLCIIGGESSQKTSFAPTTYLVGNHYSDQKKKKKKIHKANKKKVFLHALVPIIYALNSFTFISSPAPVSSPPS